MQPNSLNQVPSAWTKTTSYRIDIFSPKKSPSNSTCCIWRCQGIDLSILGLLNRLFESWTWREERCLFGESWNFTTRDPEDWRCWNFSTHGMCCFSRILRTDWTMGRFIMLSRHSWSGELWILVWPRYAWTEILLFVFQTPFLKLLLLKPGHFLFWSFEECLVKKPWWIYNIFLK